jgi:hypothetical protein
MELVGRAHDDRPACAGSRHRGCPVLAPYAAAHRDKRFILAGGDVFTLQKREPRTAMTTSSL